ncbi:MAG: hypothetical protein RR931_04030 [Mucinivorans sp.]
MKKNLFLLLFAVISNVLFAQDAILWQSQNVKFVSPIPGMKITTNSPNRFVAQMDSAVLTITLLDKFKSATSKEFYKNISARLVTLTNKSVCPLIGAVPEIYYTFLKERGFDKEEVDGQSMEVNLNNMFYGYMATMDAKNPNMERYCLILKNIKTEKFLLFDMKYNKSMDQEAGLMLMRMSNAE